MKRHIILMECAFHPAISYRFADFSPLTFVGPNDAACGQDRLSARSASD